MVPGLRKWNWATAGATEEKGGAVEPHLGVLKSVASWFVRLWRWVADFVRVPSRIAQLTSARAVESEEAFKAKLVWEDPYYFTREGHEGPFCQTCADKDQKRIRLQSLEDGYKRCNVCTNVFGKRKPSR